MKTIKAIFNYIKERFWFVVIFVAAINLIEYQAFPYWIDLTADAFGAIALIGLGVWQTINHYDG